jgi:hypothetical protein
VIDRGVRYARDVPTATDFRRIALGLKDTIERAHMGHPGRQGCTAVRLAAVDEETLGEALTLARQNAIRPARRSRTRA